MPRRSRKFTLHKAIKLAVGFGPIAGIVGSDIAASPNATGLKAAVGDLTSAYTGYDVSTNSFKWGNLLVGYVPLAGAWVVGKAMKRAGV